MGEMADIHREEAEISLMVSFGEAQELSDDEMIDELTGIITNRSDDHPHYDNNEYTPMIKNIMESYNKKRSMTDKQRNALNNHYAIHCAPPERYW